MLVKKQSKNCKEQNDFKIDDIKEKIKAEAKGGRYGKNERSKLKTKQIHNTNSHTK